MTLALSVGVLSVVQLPYGVQHALLAGLIFGAAATAWGLFAGFGGQFSFGHAALFGLPAYGAVLANEWWAVPPLVGVIASSGIVALASLLVVGPSLRLRGPFFALVTLALAEIARQWVNDQKETTGGEGGKTIARTGEGLLHLSGVGERPYVFWAAGLLIITLAASWTVLRSRLGRELTAVRDDQDIAATTGIAPTRVKMTVFVMSAFFTGLAGGLYAYSSGIVASNALLGPTISIAILVYAGVGGMRSVFGPAIGAFLLIGLEEALRIGVGASQPYLYRISYSVLFVVVLFFLPGGIASLPARLRRRHGGRISTDVDEPEAADAAGAASAPLGEAEVGSSISAPLVRRLLADLEPFQQRRSPMPDDLSLRLSHLEKRFGGLTVTDDVNFTVAPGSSVGVWGHNGSGKSTLINLVGGQLTADSGEIFLGVERVDQRPVHQRARLGMVRASQQAALYESQSANDNLLVTLFATKTLNPLRQSDFREAVRFSAQAIAAVGLPVDVLAQPAAELSTGQRKRLEMARLLVGHRPRVMLLDEPTAGIDRAGVKEMAEILRAIQDGTTASLLVVDHDEDFLVAVASSIVCLASGRVVDTVDATNERVGERLARAMVGSPRDE